MVIHSPMALRVDIRVARRANLCGGLREPLFEKLEVVMQKITLIATAKRIQERMRICIIWSRFGWCMLAKR